MDEDLGMTYKQWNNQGYRDGKDIWKGFSLVELMVVIGIISLLALVALPSYKNFILRAEFIETKMAVGAVKVSFEVCAQMLGLAKVKNCQHNSHGIPAIKKPAKGVVGVRLVSDIFDAVGAVSTKEIRLKLLLQHRSTQKMRLKLSL